MKITYGYEEITLEWVEEQASEGIQFECNADTLAASIYLD